MHSRFVSTLVAIAIPPAGVYLRIGIGVPFIVSLFLSILGIIVYFFFFSGPGLAIYGLAVLSSALLALFRTARARGPVSS